MENNGLIAQILKFLGFVAANLIGFYIVPFLFHSAPGIGLFPQGLSPDQEIQLATTISLYLPVWIIGALISIGYFFARGAKRWFLCAPIYLPLLFGLGVLVYFKFI